MFWCEVIMDWCSTVISWFRRSKSKYEDAWEIPFDSITDLVYLGSGAQGVVFGGNMNGEMVAVKKLRNSTEVNLKHLKKLNHENIVHFRGVCSQSPYFCVVMEYCQYGPLFEFIHSGVSITPKQLLRWAKEISKGMSYLHSHKIIHRDLKSPNILIGDNLVVKVSDFGTSRTWNEKSTVMSFTGTVAWMAPEVIRYEPCSERVDVWSYGVVLWEMLTQEVPYKNLEMQAIIWGIGNGILSLPIPSTCPETLKLLLNQCWNPTPRNRPPFKIISTQLEIAGEELRSMSDNTFSSLQATWRQDVKIGMQGFYAKCEQFQNQQAIGRLEEQKQARSKYEQQLTRANELYMEICALRLQIEQREKAVVEREKAVKGCRCRLRKTITQYQHPTSSSSDGLKALLCSHTSNVHRKKRQNPIEQSEQAGPPAHLLVNYMTYSKAQEPQTVNLTVTDCMGCECDNAIDNNNLNTTYTIKKTVIETNGNRLNETFCKIHDAANDKYVLDVAEV